MVQGDGSWAKALLCKCEDCICAARANIKANCGSVHLKSQHSYGKVGGRDRDHQKLLGQPASLACTVVSNRNRASYKVEYVDQYLRLPSDLYMSLRDTLICIHV